MDFKQDLFTQFARIGQALSSGKRLELVEFLARGGQRPARRDRETSRRARPQAGGHRLLPRPALHTRLRRRGPAVASGPERAATAGRLSGMEAGGVARGYGITVVDYMVDW